MSLVLTGAEGACDRRAAGGGQLPLVHHSAPYAKQTAQIVDWGRRWILWRPSLGSQRIMSAGFYVSVLGE